MAGTVLVTGGSGYIAGFLIRQLIAEGWHVKTTVRALAREAEIRRVLAVDDARLSFFTADLLDDAGWAEAVAGCSHVAHVASPFPAAAVKDAQELIRPAREGALRALRFARDAGVKRFVLTSSAAAIAYGHPGRTTPYTEADWTDVNHPDSYAYVQSKTIAERAARDWVAAEGGDMEFCSINPTLVVGPILSVDFSTSVEAIRKIVAGALPGCPDFGFGVVDVRDVADLHVRALNAPNMAGERFIASGPFLTMVEIARLLKDRLGADGRKIPTRKLPDFLVHISALFDPMVRQVIGELGKTRAIDASHARKMLGWVPRPAEESLVDTARSLIAMGVVRA
jgi:dihydroflavonol-4-reductase